MTTVLQAYKFALPPTLAQEAVLRSHCGGQRFAYNWGLARVKASLGQRDAEKSYGLEGDESTPNLSWTAYSMRKDWNAAKAEVAPWWGENSKEAHSSGLANLATALKNWETTGNFGLDDRDRRHVKLPRIGSVRTYESTRKLARHVERGTARIRSATVSYQRCRWYASFSVEIERQDPAPRNPDSVVGVDLGVKSLAVLSTGEVITNPRHLEAAQRELRRLQRQAARRVGPDKRTRPVPSNRWRKTQARITRLHAQIADARRDGLHKLTTRLVRKYGAIVIEDLNITGMLSSRGLARHVAGVGMGELRRQLTYKTTWAGTHLRVADRWYPQLQDVFGMWRGENQTSPVRTHLPMRVLRPGPRQGPQRRTQPRLTC